MYKRGVLSVTTIYFVRHVQAAGNIQRTFQGACDTDISAQGELQCQNLSDYFADLSLDAIYTSPLKRAVLTAEACRAGRKQIPVLTDDRLREICAGVWEGQPIDDLEKNDPENFRIWQQSPWDFAVEGSETMVQVFDRCRAALADILAKNAERSLAVVSHGCATRNLITAALGLPIEEMGQVEWIRNGGVSKMEFAADAIPGILVYHGYTGHIDPSTILKGGTFYSRK